MPLNCPAKFQFANEFGILRKEGVFSTIDVRHIKHEMDDECACNEKVLKLELCENITKNCHKGVTTTLIDPETESQVVIPAGSVITKWVIVDKTCGNLSCDLSFMLGYLSDCIEDETRLALLAQRVAPVDAQVTGELLNEHHKLFINDTLTASKLAAQKAIYDPEDAENGDCIEDIDYSIVRGDNFVAEAKELMPAITVTSGDLCVDDIDFFLCYIPPCEGIVCKPVVVCEPCSPKRCEKDCRSPRHSRRHGNKGGCC